MRTQAEVNNNLSFSYLPLYAEYLNTHKQKEFTDALQTALEPISKKALKIVINPSELLNCLAENSAADYIKKVTDRWTRDLERSDELSPVSSTAFTSPLLICKRVFLQFISDFSRDTEQLIGIVQDIDSFISQLETSVTQVVFNLYEEAQKTALDYQHAAILSGIGNWKWDLKTNQLYWTDHLYRMYGLEPQSEEITIEKFLEFLHPDDKPSIEKLLQGPPNEELLDFTFRIITRQGEEKALRSIAQPIVNEDGEVVAMIGSEQDVTERQQMLEDIRHSEALYKQAEKLAMIGSWSWDVERDEVKWTEELYRIFGQEPGTEINFEMYTALIHPEERDMVVKTILDSMHKVQPYAFVHRLILKDGTVRTLQSHGEVLTNKAGKPVKLVGTAQDVSERYKMIDDLQKSENLYKQAQALARIGSFNWNIKTNDVHWSDEVYKIYEIELGTPVTFQTAFEPIVPADKEKVQKAIEESFAAMVGKSVSYAISLSGNRIKYIHLETELVTDANGEVIKLLGTAQDITERQTLIEQLQESQRITQQAQSLAHMGNWVLDLKTMDFEWSDEMYNIYEISKNHKLDVKQWESFIHPDHKKEVMKYFEDTLRKRTPYEKTHKIIVGNGKVKTLYRKGEFIFDDNGEPVKMLGTTQDVTEEHRVQEALRSNQEFIKKIADATPSIIASYNINTGKYTFISEGLKKLLGYETSEVLTRGADFFVDIIHPDDVAPLVEKNIKLLDIANRPENRNRNMVEEFRYRMKHSNGNYRWFQTYGTIFDRTAEGKVEHVLNISLDITSQVEAEEKIQEQQFFIEQVADASPTILYLFDIASNSITYVNKEIFFILGYTTQEIIAMGDQVVQNLYHPEDLQLLPERRESIKKFQLRNSMIQYECRMKTKDGDWNWILVREVVFKATSEGHPLLILGAALDISKRKEIESELVQNSLKLQQSNSSLEEFAYVASHDLKEPLRKISTFGDRLMQTQSGKLGDDGKIYLNKIVDASQRMQIMINDLLSISMITGNRSFEPYSLQKVLDDVMQTLEFKIEQKKAAIKAADLPEANIVPSQFRQLFQNLLSNSLKFVKEDRLPVIRITCDFIPPEQVVGYQLPKTEKYLKLQFQDNGIGFEDEYAGKIFQIFQRLHGRSEYEGTGIGLAICKKIVEHHGGVIYAEGKPDEGSTFTIILPA